MARLRTNHSVRCAADTAPGQRGAVLFTVLAFLLLLTVLAVSGMNEARLENRMAANARFRTQALNAAEYVLTIAEHDLRNLADDPFHPDVAGDAYYALDVTDFDPDSPGIQRPADPVWTFSHAVVPLPGLDDDGRADNGTGSYVIQDAGTALAPGTGRGSTLHVLPGTRVQAFLVTARAGAARGTQRTVQSMVVTEPLDTHSRPAARTTGRHLDRIGWIDLQP